MGAEISGRTMQRTLIAALNYEKCLACVKGWLSDSSMNRRVEYASLMYKDIQSLKTGIAYDSVTKCTSDMVLRVNYESLDSPEHDIDGTAFNIAMHRLKKIENASIHGRRWASISSQASSFRTYRATAMAR